MAIKEVRVDLYCKECKYYEKSEADDPCFDCLREPVNTFTHRPTEFKERGNT